MANFIRCNEFSIKDVACAKKHIEELIEMAREKLEYLDMAHLSPPMDVLRLEVQNDTLCEIICLQEWLADMNELMSEHLVNQPARGNILCH